MPAGGNKQGQAAVVGSGSLPQPILLTPSPWVDYELLDSGDGQKLERFGPYRWFARRHRRSGPPSLPASAWSAAEAQFQRTRTEDGPGEWLQRSHCQNSGLCTMTI